jgi:ribosomal protein L20A (L18A)
MRKYSITYWAERNDEATDFEVELEADNIEEAVDKLYSRYRPIKRITKVEEINNQL